MTRNLVTLINQEQDRKTVFYRVPAVAKKGEAQETRELTLGSSLDLEPAELTKDEEDPRHRIPSPEVQVPRAEWEAIQAWPAAKATIAGWVRARAVRVID